MSTRDKAKALMYVCFGVAALAAAFQIGATTVHGQVGDQDISVAFAGGIDNQKFWVITAGGDVYKGDGWGQGIPVSWHYDSNVFGNGPIPTQSESWGSLKAKSK